MSLRSEIGQPDNRYAVKYHDGVNENIRTVLERALAASVREAAPIAYRFKGRDRIETAKNIFTYLKNDVTYQKDPDGYQDIRRPRFFHHSLTGDCKSFALNTLAIWANLYPQDKIYFFYAAYDGGDTPTHVYAVIEPKGQSPIIIDGCWYFFNREKTYTLGFKSKNMQIRELSGVVPHDPSELPAPIDYLNKIYNSLNERGKAEFKSLLKQKLSFELIKLQRENGEISAIECMQRLEAIEGIGRIRKGKRKGGKGKKFLHWFNAAALFLGRASFLLFVTLNVNGLASKLADLHKWGKDSGVMSTWYMLGGNQKKFLQIIQRGAKKKKLFLSKKAKEKYEQRYGPLSPNEVAYNLNQGKHISGPELAAAAVAVVPVLAALIPKMIAGFRAAGPQGHAAAAGLIGEGHDMVNNLQAVGYSPTGAELTNAFLPNGHSFNAGPMDARAAAQLKKKGGLNFVFDLKDWRPIQDGEDTSAVPDTVPADANTTIPAASEDGSVSIPDTPNPVDKFTSDMETLGPLLKTVSSVGLTTAGAVMSQSQNPNIRKWGGALDGAESALTGNALRRAGYPADAAYHDKLSKGTTINLVPVLAFIGGAYAIKELVQEKK